MSIVDRLLSSNEVLGVVVSAILTIIIALATQIFRRKAKLRWADTYSNHFIIPSQDGKVISVLVKDVWVQNTGRAVARDIEICLNFKPQHFEIYPHVPYDIHQNADQRFFLVFKKLNPGEYQRISLHNINADLPMTSNVRFDGGQGIPVTTELQVKAPFRLRAFVSFLILMGFFSTIYVVVRLIQALI